ncbi:Transcription factor TFIIIB component B [Heracleum sosnowskyi]|uniref:Transcription factor TFIIIB component B n=1 Tax=Heracleum sosnowskyi TaxID=360622 RepID=A0AAD8HIR3_9APIA|nr:Transcription factor TFIIIB component B [Heracleum sosnowskyi]
MDFELDPLDDIFADNAAKNARPSGKFRPKAKPRPRKESSASVQSTQCTQPITVSEYESKNASENAVDGFVVVPLLNDNKISKLTNLSTEHLADKEPDVSATGSRSEAILSGISGDYNSPFGSLEGEKGDIGSSLGVSDGFLSQITTVTETKTTYVDSSRNEEVILGSTRDTRLDRGLQPCNNSGFCLAPELPASLDNLTYGEFTSTTDGYFQEGDTSPFLETQNITTEFTSMSGRHIEKLQPKPKLQSQEETHFATVSNVDDVLPVPFQTDNFDEDSIPAVPLDDMIDFSSMELDDSVLTDPALEIPGFVETSQFNKQNSVPFPTDRERGNTDTGLEHSVEHQLPSTSGLEEKRGRSSKRRGKQKLLLQLVDEPEEQDLETGQVTAEYPEGSAVNEDNHTDKDYQLEEDRPNKRARGKSKKSVAEKGKTVRKRKKANEASEQSNKKLTKKFSHSTRRRGRFDKDWLKTPEDELEISDLSLKDIILLGEYREWIAKKNPEASQTPVTNQSTTQPSTRYYEDDDMIASEQDQEFNDEHENVTVQDNGTYFNYQSHMKKTPRGKWTKQDTELFYQALQQFGTDLTMITQLFPGRTRNQIKLKYKREERDHPMRLHDALTTRSKDHSHFQLIVDQVKKAVAERKQNSETDDLDGLLGEEPEEVPPKTDETTKSAQVEQSEVEHMEDDVPAATGPVDSSESDDDEKRWSQFRSDL